MVPTPHPSGPRQPVCPLPLAQSTPDSQEPSPRGADESSFPSLAKREMVFLLSLGLFSSHCRELTFAGLSGRLEPGVRAQTCTGEPTIW